MLGWVIAFVLLGLPLLSALYVATKGLLELRERRETERRNAEVRRTGERHAAVVRAVEQTGKFINEKPELRVTVEVQPTGSTPYEAAITRVVTLVELARMQPGLHVTVATVDGPPRLIALCELEPE